MNPRLRVLVITYTFPPSVEVGGQRLSRLCHHLPAGGVDPVVLTVDERYLSNRDASLPLPEGVRIVRSGMIRNPLEYVAEWKKSLPGPTAKPATAGPDRDSKWLRRQILAALKVPDRHWGWYWPALRKARQILREEMFDAILSSGPPWTSHMIARRLRSEFGLPWLADFRDPWANFVNHQEPQWWLRMSYRMEQNCIREADRVICNTDRLRLALQGVYSREAAKFCALPNGYEPSTAQRMAAAKDGPRLFVHMGSIYGRRRIDTFCQAISGLVKAGTLDQKKFKLVFQGDVSPSFIAQVGEITPELLSNGCIEFRPRVDWDEAQRTLWHADLLLLFQGDHRLQVPAKVYEYLPTGIPIFAVAEEGAVTDLLSDLGAGIHAHPEDPVEIAERFLMALKLPRRDPEVVRASLNGKFLYSTLGKRLGNLIREAVGPGAGLEDETAMGVAESLS